MSLLWEGIINLWNPGDNKGQKTSQTNNKKKYQYCNCNISHSEEYCDNIYSIIQMLKNNNIASEKNKILYEGLLKVHEKLLDMNGDNMRQIKKDLNRTYPSSSIFKDDRIIKKLKNSENRILQNKQGKHKSNSPKKIKDNDKYPNYNNNNKKININSKFKKIDLNNINHCYLETINIKKNNKTSKTKHSFNDIFLPPQ